MTNDLRNEIANVLIDDFSIPEKTCYRLADAILAKLDPDALIEVALEVAGDAIAPKVKPKIKDRGLYKASGPEPVAQAVHDARKRLADNIRALAADPAVRAAIKAKAGWSE